MKSDLGKNLKVIDIAYDGRAVAKDNGMVFFIEKAVPGDIVNVFVKKKRKNFVEARVSEVVVPSSDRIQPECSHFGYCGGCKWQHFDYSKQLAYKEKQVSDALHHLAGLNSVLVKPIIKADEIYYYRNKLDYSFAAYRWLTPEEIQDKSILKSNAAGFHLPGMFDKVLDINHCMLQPEPSNEFRIKLKNFCIENDIPFYNSKNHTGIIRSLIIRNNVKKQFMVNIVLATESMETIHQIMSYMSETFDPSHSFYYTINTKKNDSIHDLNPVHFSGPLLLNETLGNRTFQFGPMSFFQTNSKQAIKLYDVVKEMASLTGTEKVYDMYCGTGTIALYISENAGKVVGLEYVPQAVDDAQKNAALNEINHCHFIAGDIAQILNGELLQSYGKPDVIICDPPRSGMHRTVIEKLLSIKAPKLIYVSCNPATQARDIEYLSEVYAHQYSQPVDMFPQTHHVENVALLTMKN